jgi:hypothetical protein
MKIKLHRPQSNLWVIALLLFILGMVGTFLRLPILGAFAFQLIGLSAALLILGTWII